MGCSAAYWLACNADEIIANNSTAIVGSIGVLMSFADVQPMYEAQGIKFHKILAPQSKDKTAMYDKLRSGDYEQYKNEVLKPLADKFISVVMDNRPNLEDSKHFTGKTFFAKDTVGELIDSIGSLEFAISRAAQLSELSASNSNQIQSKIKIMEYPNLAQASGVESFESIDNTVTLTAEMAEAVEIALVAGSSAQSEIEANIVELSNLSGTVAERDSSIVGLNATITELNTQIEALKQAPGAINPRTTEATDAASGSENMNFLSADTIALYKQIKQ